MITIKKYDMIIFGWFESIKVPITHYTSSKIVVFDFIFSKFHIKRTKHFKQTDNQTLRFGLVRRQIINLNEFYFV